jgi:D-alanyl-D-alanine carboxypeptidase/D-alanyl-D-alanine-endopeptidase (penicillin-binding protein 4)
MKIVSTLCALKILGPDFKFQTQLWIDGIVENSVLKGDLYLKGTGDPFLTASDLMNLSLLLKKTGIQAIQGDFLFDESFFVSEKSIDKTQDFSSGYNAGLSALSSEFNQIPLRWKINSKECFLEAFSIPDLPLFEFGLSLQKGEESSERLQLFYDHSPSLKDQWVFTPPQKVRENSKEGMKMIPIKQPGLFTAYFFKSLSELNGIILPDPRLKKVPLKARKIVFLNSLSLVELVQKALEHSNNLMTELIHLRAAKALTKKALPLREASLQIQKWLKRQVQTKDWASFYMENGSGLGGLSRLSPRQLVDILRWSETMKFTSRSYLTLLPISGWKGTLSQRLHDTQSAFRVWAKTGTQSYASGLGGFLFSKSGKELVFSIFLTDFEQRKAFEKSSGAEKENQSQWIMKAKNIEEKLLLRWLQDF